jgi:RNA recognition motif-containing protein
VDTVAKKKVFKRQCALHRKKPIVKSHVKLLKATILCLRTSLNDEASKFANSMNTTVGPIDTSCGVTSWTIETLSMRPDEGRPANTLEGASLAQHTRSANNSMCNTFATSPYFSSFSQNFEFLSGVKTTESTAGVFGSSLGGLSTYFGSSGPSSSLPSAFNQSDVALFLKSSVSLAEEVVVAPHSDAGQTDELNSPQSPLAAGERWSFPPAAERSSSAECPTVLSSAATALPAPSSNENCNRAECSNTGNIFVTHLPTHVDDNKLRALFEPYGGIVSSVVMRDIFSGASRGVGFVLFNDGPSADRAIAAMHRSSVAGKTITVQRGKNFAQGTPTTRVFIRNIPKGVTEGQVRELCAPYGQITWLSVHSDSVKSSSNSSKAPRRNIAFVNYTSIDEAKAAADGLHATRPFIAYDEPGDHMVPILTKVVVENLPTKTTRKERRAVGNVTGDECIGSSLENATNSTSDAVDRFLATATKKKLLGTNVHRASSPERQQHGATVSTNVASVAKRRSRGVTTPAAAATETIQFSPQVVVPLGGEGEAITAAAASRSSRCCLIQSARPAAVAESVGGVARRHGQQRHADSAPHSRHTASPSARDPPTISVIGLVHNLEGSNIKQM